MQKYPYYPYKYPYDMSHEEWYIKPDEIVKKSIKYWELCNAAKFIYFLIDKNVIVYVGKTEKIHSRLKTHTKDKKFDRVVWIQVPKEKMNFIEMYYINLLKPKYNKAVPVAMDIPKAIIAYGKKNDIKDEIIERWIELRGYDFEGLKKFYYWWRRERYAPIKKSVFGKELVDEYVRLLTQRAADGGQASKI